MSDEKASAQTTRCHVCGQRTNLRCADCQIDLAARVYVCANPKCRDRHATKCPGTREKPFNFRALRRLREASYEK